MRRWHCCIGLVLAAAFANSAPAQTLSYWNEPDNQVAVSAQFEYINWHRSLGVANRGLVSQTPSPAGTVLAIDDAALPNADGLRMMIGMPVTEQWLAEFGYFNQQSVTRTATAGSPTGPDILFSTFSDFGADPVGGFAETDQARQASLSYTSQMESYEINAKRVMIVDEGPLTCALLIGARGIKLHEHSEHTIDAPLNAANMYYQVQTRNSLFGVQGGTESWCNIHDYLSGGVQIKMGVLINEAEQQTTIAATSLPAPMFENADSSLAAFMLDLSLMLRVRLNDVITLRAGYQMLLIDNVALAPGQFDFTPPFIAPGFINPPRTPGAYDDASVLYYGYSAGVEAMW